MQTLKEPIQYCLKTPKFGVILVKIWGFVNKSGKK
jgi:hypothetical protein